MAGFEDRYFSAVVEMLVEVATRKICEREEQTAGVSTRWQEVLVECALYIILHTFNIIF